MTAVMKPIARHMEETGISVDQLVTAAGLDAKLIKAIVSGNYTPSPSQRQRLAAALVFRPMTFPGGTRSRSNTCAATVRNVDAQLDLMRMPAWFCMSQVVLMGLQ